MNTDLLLKIANKYTTPAYVYDAEVIRKQYQKLQKAFHNLPYRIHYAMKANENIEILKLIKGLGLGVDAVSPNEISRALKVGFKPEDIVFTPSCPSLDELDYAFNNKIHIHIGAVEYLEYIVKNYKHTAIGIRINPGNSIGGNQKIATAHQNSKFGIPVSQLDKIKAYIERGLQIDSLHLHTGSDVKSWQDLARSVDTIFDFAKHFDQLKYIDLGSGFKVKYQENDPEIDLQSYANHIEKTLKNCRHDIEIKFEPGKFIVSESGVLLTKVNVVKQGFQKKFVGLNSGFHHLIRPMYYDAYHHIVNLSNTEGKMQVYDVVGQLCEEDTFAYDRKIQEVKTGDILAILNAGAYGYSLSSDYNLRERPNEYLVDGEQVTVVR
jgi:diaminopimelate decarboxylase